MLPVLRHCCCGRRAAVAVRCCVLLPTAVGFLAKPVGIVQVLQVHKAFLKRKRPLYAKRQEAIAEVPDFWLKVVRATALSAGARAPRCSSTCGLFFDVREASLRSYVSYSSTSRRCCLFRVRALVSILGVFLGTWRCSAATSRLPCCPSDGGREGEKRWTQTKSAACLIHPPSALADASLLPHVLPNLRHSSPFPPPLCASPPSSWRTP